MNFSNELIGQRNSYMYVLVNCTVWFSDSWEEVVKRRTLHDGQTDRRR